MADQLICQTVFARCSKRVNLLNFYPTKLSHYTILKFCDLKIPCEISKNNKPRNSTYTVTLYVPVKLFSLNLFTYTRALPSSSQLVIPNLTLSTSYIIKCVGSWYICHCSLVLFWYEILNLVLVLVVVPKVQVILV